MYVSYVLYEGDMTPNRESVCGFCILVASHFPLLLTLVVFFLPLVGRCAAFSAHRFTSFGLAFHSALLCSAGKLRRRGAQPL